MEDCLQVQLRKTEWAAGKCAGMHEWMPVCSMYLLKRKESYLKFLDIDTYWITGKEILLYIKKNSFMYYIPLKDNWKKKVDKQSGFSENTLILI